MPRIDDTPKHGTDIHLKQAPGEMVRVFVNGELVAEVVAQKATVAKDWESTLDRARGLIALPKLLRFFSERLRKVHNREDHNHPKPNDKVVALLMGFADGMLGIDNPHPANKDFEGLNLRMQRDYSPCFSEGFETGEVIRNLVGNLE